MTFEIKTNYDYECDIYADDKLIWETDYFQDELQECKTKKDVEKMVWGWLRKCEQPNKFFITNNGKIVIYKMLVEHICTDYDVKDTPMVFSDCKISDNEFEFCIDGELVGWEIPKIPTTATKDDVEKFVIGEIFCPMVGKIPFSPYEENQVIDYLTDAFCDHYGIDKGGN